MVAGGKLYNVVVDNEQVRPLLDPAVVSAGADVIDWEGDLVQRAAKDAHHLHPLVQNPSEVHS